MTIAKDNLSQNAMGGTELMKFGLINRLPKELLEHFQIFVSRVQEPLDSNKIKIYWHHDLPNDPSAVEPLKNNGWKNFDILVFNSNWQQTEFQRAFNIPYWKCVVLYNAIEPIENHKKPDPTEHVNLIYHTTPHRGLQILVPVFQQIAEKDKNITLDVYSSFKMYGWDSKDKDYENLFEMCEKHPQINYHGYKPNSVIHEALKNSHIYSYPSIWTETSCISLMEAMSAKNVCVHSNLGALWDTSGGLTRMYQYDEDINIHASRFSSVLQKTIQDVRSLNMENELNFIKSYADLRFNWSRRALEWKNLLETLLNMKNAGVLKNREEPKKHFVYRT
jgi:glycosyltransferase involved in cell wall biosynthesis